jgi:hypothetical protein
MVDPSGMSDYLDYFISDIMRLDARITLFYGPRSIRESRGPQQPARIMAVIVDTNSSRRH